MENKDFTTTMAVDQSPAEVFQAINKPREWWSVEIKGEPDRLNSPWNYQFGDNHRSKIVTTEMVPNEKVVWRVEENYFKNARNQTEWVGNEITFHISKQGNKTQLTFTQVGLVASCDCYKSCEWAWTGFVQKSLHSLITTQKGKLDWYK